MYELFSLV